MRLSDKIIKAKDVKLAEKPLLPASRFVRSQPVGKDGELVNPGVAGQEGEEQRITEVKKEAYERGFSEGLLLQKNECLQVMKTLSNLISEVGELKKKFYEETEGQMLDLVFSIAGKVIHTEVNTNRNIVLAVLREAIKNIVDRDGIKIRLHPQDFRLMMDMKPDFLKEMNGMKNVVFEEDAGINQGGAVLETLSGEVDARLERQLHETKMALNAK
jgi:flagellar assembly protein FliH